MLDQLDDALALLKEVRAATETGDPTRLAALAARAGSSCPAIQGALGREATRGEQMQGEALRLQELDRELRARP